MTSRLQWTSLCLGICAVCVLAVPAQGQSLAHAEALWKSRDYDGANREFRALVAEQPKNPGLRVRWAQLFVERFNKEEAVNLYREALQIKPDDTGALLGIASVMAEGFEATAKEYALKALAVDPKLYRAHEILARVALEDNDIPAAVSECDKALSSFPDALDGMTIRATVDWLADRKDSPWIGKILAIDPRYGQAYATAGYYFVLNRRYDEGIELYRKALAVSPDLWSARSQLGVNLMRMGKEEEARAELEIGRAHV